MAQAGVEVDNMDHKSKLNLRRWLKFKLNLRKMAQVEAQVEVEKSSTFFVFFFLANQSSSLQGKMLSVTSGCGTG